MKNLKPIIATLVLFSLSAQALEPTADSSGMFCKHKHLDTGVIETYYIKLFNAPAACPAYVHTETNNSVTYTKIHAAFEGNQGPPPVLVPQNDPFAQNCITLKARIGGGH